MIRDGKTERISQVLNTVVEGRKNLQQKAPTPYLLISKQDLWLQFLDTFRLLTGKRLISDEQTKNNYFFEILFKKSKYFKKSVNKKMQSKTFADSRMILDSNK